MILALPTVPMFAFGARLMEGRTSIAMAIVASLVTAALSAVGLAVLGVGTMMSNEKMVAKLEEKYLNDLDGWVGRGGPFGEVQGVVVPACGQLVMAMASTTEKAALMTTGRSDFDFMVDVCVKMTVHRRHPQPEFERADTVATICSPTSPAVFARLCKRTGLR